MAKSKIKKLEEKLNKEYEGLGTISIRSIAENNIPIKSIDYVESIMRVVKPIKNDEPIIVAEKWGWEKRYKLIDGYHRLKSKILNQENINVIILENYNLDRCNDNLYLFIESLIGKTLKFIDCNTIEIDNKFFFIKENEGCGGCGNGWSSISVKSELIGKKIKIKSVSRIEDKHDEDLYELYINGKIVAKVNTGWGNGYYGGDFEIELAI